MRKYIFNSALLGVLFGGISLTRQTIKSPRNWRTILMWIGWAISIAVAIGEIREEAREEQERDEYGV
jgi:hypothetical protein